MHTVVNAPQPLQSKPFQFHFYLSIYWTRSIHIHIIHIISQLFIPSNYLIGVVQTQEQHIFVADECVACHRNNSMYSFILRLLLYLRRKVFFFRRVPYFFYPIKWFHSVFYDIVIPFKTFFFFWKNNRHRIHKKKRLLHDKGGW